MIPYSPMRIAYILDTYPALSETFIAREIEELRRQGFEIEIFAFHAGEGARAIAGAGMLHDLPLKAASRWSVSARTQRWKGIGARWWQGLPSTIREGIGHIHGGFASHPAALAWGAAEAAGLSWSFSGHARDLYLQEFDLAGHVAAASFATSCTHAGVEILKRAQGRERVQGRSLCEVTYIPHGLEIWRYPFAPRTWQPGEAARIVSVGRLVEKKGFDVLLEALDSLPRRGFPFTATIIGDGPQKQLLQSRIAAIEPGAHVQLAGELPHEGVIAAMQAAHCFVFAGRVARDEDRDGLPNVLLEAAALGLPLVSTSAGSTTDFIDATTGLLCPPDDAAALASAIAQVFTDWEASAQRAHAARARVAALFDLGRNVAPLAKLFRRHAGTNSR